MSPARWRLPRRAAPAPGSSGADLLIDQITVDTLSAHGVDVEATLAEMTDLPSDTIAVKHEGQDLPLTLINDSGTVTVLMAMS